MSVSRDPPFGWREGGSWGLRCGWVSGGDDLTQRVDLGRSAGPRDARGGDPGRVGAVSVESNGEARVRCWVRAGRAGPTHRGVVGAVARGDVGGRSGAVSGRGGGRWVLRSYLVSAAGGWRPGCVTGVDGVACVSGDRYGREVLRCSW